MTIKISKIFARFKATIVQAALLFLISCASSVSIDETLNKVYALTHTLPDSASAILNRISQQDLNQAQDIYYQLLKIRVNDLHDKDITADTTMLALAKNYFLLHGPPEKLALAYFYSGRIHSENGNLKAATEDFLKAIDYSGNDLAVKGKSESNMGWICYETGAYEKSIEWYKKVYVSYKNDNPKSSADSYVGIGDGFLLLRKPDSAMFYYNRALDISKNINDNSFSADIIQRTIVALTEAGDYAQAKELCGQYYGKSDFENDKEKEYFWATDMATIYYQTDQSDSVLHYAKIAEKYAIEQHDLDKLISSYQLLSLAEEEKSNYRQALAYYRQEMKYEKELSEQTAYHEVLEVQKKYNHKELESTNQQLVIEKQQTIIISILIIILLLLALWILNRKILKNKAEKIKAEEDRIFLKEMIEDYEKSARNFVLEQMGIVKQVAALDNAKGNEGKAIGVSKIIKQLTKERMVNTINHLNSDFITGIGTKFPQLGEDEVIICAMHLLEFNSHEIAAFFKLKTNTIQQKESEIRRKLNLKPRSSLKEYIETNMEALPIFFL